VKTTGSFRIMPEFSDADYSVHAGACRLVQFTAFRGWRRVMFWRVEADQWNCAGV